MRKQPHKHHNGPITAELCEGLIQDFAQMSKDVPIDPPFQGDDWYLCRGHWLQEFEYAVLRLREVMDDVETNDPFRHMLHNKIIDICLSIKDDFAYAKLHNFVDPTYND